MRVGEVKYFDEDIKSAVLASKNYSEVLTILGSKSKYAYHIKKRIEKLGLDVSHFEKGKYSKKQMENACSKSKSYSEVVRVLGLVPIGGNINLIKNRIKYFDIDISHFTFQAHRKGKVSDKKKSAKEIFIRRAVGSHRYPPRILRRALLEIGREEVCEECEQGTEWNGKFLRLPIDHKDGDYLNNEEDNLRFLCPNCHSQTSDYCGKGFGKNKKKEEKDVRKSY